MLEKDYNYRIFEIALNKKIESLGEGSPKLEENLSNLSNIKETLKFEILGPNRLGMYRDELLHRVEVSKKSLNRILERNHLRDEELKMVLRTKNDLEKNRKYLLSKQFLNITEAALEKIAQIIREVEEYNEDTEYIDISNELFLPQLDIYLMHLEENNMQEKFIEYSMFRELYVALKKDIDATLEANSKVLVKQFI